MVCIERTRSVMHSSRSIHISTLRPCVEVAGYLGAKSRLRIFSYIPANLSVTRFQRPARFSLVGTSLPRILLIPDMAKGGCCCGSVKSTWNLRTVPREAPEQGVASSTARSKGVRQRPMYVVMVAAECAPAAQAGGLGDVVYGLSREVEIRGHAVEIILPKYDCMRYDQIWGLHVIFPDLWVPWYSGRVHCSVWLGFVRGRKCFSSNRIHKINSSTAAPTTVLQTKTSVSPSSARRPPSSCSRATNVPMSFIVTTGILRWSRYCCTRSISTTACTTSASATRCTTFATRGLRARTSCGQQESVGPNIISTPIECATNSTSRL